MTVIAMTREMGTLGKDVALGLAETLDLRIVHHELVEHDLAERLGVQESAVHHYLEGGASLLERWKIDKQKLSRYTAQEILEFVQQGNIVIRGWGATALLRDIPNVLRIRVCAPMAFRERVMMERLGLKEAGVVRREIERSDAAHSRLMQGSFGLDWKNPTLYHAVLNTGIVPVDACVNTVRLLADQPAFEETEATRRALKDKLLEWEVRAALAERHGRGAGVTGVDVAAKDGAIILSGSVTHPHLPAVLMQTTRAVPGVVDVESRIMTVMAYGFH
jgi:cytidylate kinase